MHTYIGVYERDFVSKGNLPVHYKTSTLKMFIEAELKTNIAQTNLLKLLWYLKKFNFAPLL